MPISALQIFFTVNNRLLGFFFCTGQCERGVIRHLCLSRNADKASQRFRVTGHNPTMIPSDSCWTCSSNMLPQ
jgi:hypothetical protein